MKLWFSEFALVIKRLFDKAKAKKNMGEEGMAKDKDDVRGDDIRLDKRLRRMKPSARFAKF